MLLHTHLSLLIRTTIPLKHRNIQQATNNNNGNSNNITSNDKKLQYLLLSSSSLGTQNRIKIAKIMLPIALLLSSTIVIASNPVQSAYAITFGKTKNLSNNAGESDDPQIISSDGRIYVVWVDKTPGNFDIFFKKGVD
jgi:hypothetical protein